MAVFPGPPAAGYRRPLAAGREELSTCGGGGDQGGLPLGPTPVNNRVGDLPLAGFPRGGNQPRRGPPGTPTAGPESGQVPLLLAVGLNRLDHNLHEWSVMEVGQVLQVAPVSNSTPGPDGMYQVSVNVQGGIHQALLDSGSSHTLIHQSLVRPEALLEASWVRFGCLQRHVSTPDLGNPTSWGKA